MILAISTFTVIASFLVYLFSFWGIIAVLAIWGVSALVREKLVRYGFKLATNNNTRCVSYWAVYLATLLLSLVFFGILGWGNPENITKTQEQNTPSRASDIITQEDYLRYTEKMLAGLEGKEQDNPSDQSTVLLSDKLRMLVRSMFWTWWFHTLAPLTLIIHTVFFALWDDMGRIREAGRERFRRKSIREDLPNQPTTGTATATAGTESGRSPFTFRRYIIWDTFIEGVWHLLRGV